MEGRMTNLQEKVEKIAEQNFLNWAKLLKTKDPRQVAELYSEDVTFLPTLSSEFKKGQAGAEEYFEHFLKKDPTGEIIDKAVQPLGKDTYLHSGMYNFEVGSSKERSTVEARFTYVWKRNEDDKWEIIHHHSSLKPE